MLIDWFTVAAQTLNFLVLLWLLQRFLYKPILAAVDARESRIASQLADAAAKTAEAKKDRDEFQQKNKTFDQERAGLLATATGDAKAERQRLIDDAGKAADVLAASRKEALRASAQSLNAAIGRRAQDQVFSIARKTLTDLAAASLDDQMVDVFLRRLSEMDGSEKALLASALTNTTDPATLRSAFDLPLPQRATIQDAVDATFSASVPLRFETAPDLIGGIELVSNGQKISWSIANYLTVLKNDVSELAQGTGIEAKKSEINVDIKLAPKAL